MIYETSITNPKKQLEFYKDLSEQLQQENEELKKQLEKKYEKVGTLTAEILYEENTRLVNEITVLKTENKQLKEQLQQKEDIINKAKEYIINNSLYEEEYDYDYEENIYLSGIHDEDVRIILVEILDNKGE